MKPITIATVVLLFSAVAFSVIGVKVSMFRKEIKSLKAELQIQDSMFLLYANEIHAMRSEIASLKRLNATLSTMINQDGTSCQ